MVPACSASWVVPEHRLWTCRHVPPEQKPLGQVEHAKHTLSVVGVHGLSSYWLLRQIVQEVHGSRAQTLPVLYVPAGHAEHELEYPIPPCPAGQFGFAPHTSEPLQKSPPGQQYTGSAFPAEKLEIEAVDALPLSQPP
eukprot:3935067-Rhodomonas_salina.1